MRRTTSLNDPLWIDVPDSEAQGHMELPMTSGNDFHRVATQAARGQSNSDFSLRFSWFRSGTGRTGKMTASRLDENFGPPKATMRTNYSIIIRILAFVSLAAYPADAQWVRWETSAAGNGHWYRPVPGFPGLTWTLADQLARGEGGYLATLNSPAENAFVFSLVDAPQFWTKFNGSGPALGGFQQDGAVEPAGGWDWNTGETWSYSNWLPGQPDNNPWRPPEDRLHFWGGGPRAVTWNDIQRDDPNLGGYVVESDITPRGLAVTGLPSFGGYVVQSDTSPRPRLSIRPGGELCWTTVTNIQYQLQWAASVNSTDWMSLGPVVPGTGGTVCISDRATGEGQRFYRVRIMP